MKDSIPGRFRPEDRSSAILKAAFSEFTREGYAAARMESIAVRAGVTKGLIYFYYKNKQELFEAVFRECVKKPFHGPLLDMDPAESMASHLARVLATLYHQLVDTPFFAQLARLILMEGQRFPEMHAYYYREIIQPTMDLLHDLLEEGARRGEWKKAAVPEFTHMLMAPCILFVLWRMTLNQYMSVDLEHYCREHQRTMLRSLGLTEQATEDALRQAARKAAENPHGLLGSPDAGEPCAVCRTDAVKQREAQVGRRAFVARAALRRRPKNGR